MMAGERVVAVGDLTLSVDEKGAVANRADLDALARSSAYRDFLQSPTSTGAVAAGPGSSSNADTAMSVDFRLAKPVDVYSVPAAAVYDIAGTDACILSDGSSRAVTIADSQLGQTFVVPVKAKPLRTVSLEHRGAPACR
jgi:hypothetical protein